MSFSMRNTIRATLRGYCNGSLLVFIRALYGFSGLDKGPTGSRRVVRVFMVERKRRERIFTRVTL